MNRFYRFSGVFFWLVSFFVRGWYIKCCTKDPVKLRNRLARNTSFISRKLLKCFRISVKVINPEKLQILDRENHLIVSNHVSYTDILVLSACYPFIFITSLEMAANPVLGDITKMGGSLFTNRKQYTSLPQEINNFANALMTGFNIVLFPEGTSTNGETIREFRKSLFQTSITAQKPILPICVRYTSINGRPFALQQDRDKVCWYGDMPF
ncbi:MAG: 1-acyl-sn-glycerol-3-phosphate acyltransferase, partial [Candidatus Cloacimonetes bacterium]|nr:1-acyl-sn-glycerol-3-phosphate acyltransferase [Candidatus Cloacimonadota bacterium]